MCIDRLILQKNTQATKLEIFCLFDMSVTQKIRIDIENKIQLTNSLETNLTFHLWDNFGWAKACSVVQPSMSTSNIPTDFSLESAAIEHSRFL